MQKKLELAYRGLLALFLFTLIWSVWSATAQTASPGTNQTAPAVSSPAPALEDASGDDRVTPAHATGLPGGGWIERLAEQFPILKRTLWGNEYWKYLFSLVYIFLAFYVSKLLDYLTRVWLKRWAAKTKTNFDDLVLELLNGPIKLVAFIIFLRIGLDVFAWPALVQNLLTKGFTVVVAAVLTYLLLKFIDLALGYWRQRTAAVADQAFNQQLFPIIRKSLKAFVVVVAVLTTLNNMGVNITAAIASLSIGGLAVGLAAQDTLANLFGAVAIFLDRPFKIGERVQVDGHDGAVESIGMRSTRIRNLDGHLVTIPNKTMGNATIVNVQARPNIKTVMNLGITYDTPADQVKRALAIIKEIYGGHPKTGDLLVSFNKFDSSALNILVVHWWKDPDFVASLAGLQEMNLQLKERFDAEGIQFAFPTQTVHLKQSRE
jgi:MscS family membrane protein